MDAFCSVFYHYSIVYQYCKGKKSGNVFTNSEQSYFSLCFVSGKNHYLSVHLFIAVLRDCFGSKIGFSLFESTRFRIVVFQDRKSTRLNSSHVRISYAVFCLKKKKN